MRRLFAAAAAILCFSTADIASAQSAKILSDLCTSPPQGTETSTARANCTRAIESRKLKGQQLALLHVYRGLYASDMGDQDQAWGDADAALKIHPKMGQAYYVRSVVLIRRPKSQYREAIGELTKAIALMPGYFGAYSERARLKAYIGDYKGAAADMQAVIKLAPNDGQARGLLTSYEQQARLRMATDLIESDP